MSEPEDPWERARARQQADVAAALARRERRCPACGAPERGAGRTCTNCGEDLTARLSGRRSRRAVLLAVLAVLVIAGAAVPVVSGLRDDAAAERERVAQRQTELEAAERVRLTREGRPVRATGPRPRRGTAPLAHRRALVARGEALIAEDARGRVAAGRLDGTIRGASCSPYPNTEGRRAAEQSDATTVGRYDCVAYTSKFEAPEVNGQARTGLFGFPYWLVIEYARAELVLCRVAPRAGEGGVTLESVPVPEPCRDPPGPG